MIIVTGISFIIYFFSAQGFGIQLLADRFIFQLPVLFRKIARLMSFIVWDKRVYPDHLIICQYSVYLLTGITAWFNSSVWWNPLLSQKQGISTVSYLTASTRPASSGCRKTIKQKNTHARKALLRFVTLQLLQWYGTGPLYIDHESCT